MNFWRKCIKSRSNRKGGNMMRKALVKVVFMVAALSLALVGWPGPAPGAEKGPIKIGFIAPMTGGMAQVGKDMSNGAEMYFEEIGYKVAGRKIEVILEDTQAVPAIALTKARKLVESDKVHVLTGGLLASTGYALAPYVTAQKIPMVYQVMAADDLTQRQPSKYIVRTGWSSSQPSHPFGEWVYKTLGYKKVVTFAADYAFGYEVVGGFQKTFEEAGGKVIQKIWMPLATVDFAPYIAQIKRDADAVFALMVGAMALRFPKQYQEAGLKERIPVIGGGTTTDEFVLPSLGDEVIGYITPLQYSAALDTPINKRFAQSYRKKYGKVPGYYSETSYTGARWIVEAAKAINGDVENKEKFLEALRKLELKDAPKGPLRLDEFANPIQNIYVRKVEKVAGELQNTVIHTFENVSQFWKYDPKEFLKQPVYSRDFPPCKYCD